MQPLLIIRVRPPSAVPLSHIITLVWFLAALLLVWPPATVLGRDARVFEPCFPCWRPNFWFLVGPGLTNAFLWRVKQHTKDLLLCLSLYLSNTQNKSFKKSIKNTNTLHTNTATEIIIVLYSLIISYLKKLFEKFMQDLYYEKYTFVYKYFCTKVNFSLHFVMKHLKYLDFDSLWEVANRQNVKY